MKYRLYVAEVGNSDMGASHDPNHRYLSLTGVIIELGHVRDVVFPEIEGLKRRFFASHPDEPLILHRKELVNKSYPFHALRNPGVESLFNNKLLGLLRELNYVVITVVIDKLEHNQHYQVWKFDPYHYSLAVVLERYILWLKRNDCQGDVMAESRGGKEDRRLKASFSTHYNRGTDFLASSMFVVRLTSNELKIKPKSNNIAGLQLADLIAHPSYKATLAHQNQQDLPDNFGGRIAKILESSKYNRSPEGEIEGWGRKWLP